MEGHVILDKYQPKALCDMVDSEDAIKLFNTFISDEEARVAIMIGPSGSGKTALSRLMFKDHNITCIYEPDYDHVISHKEFESHLSSFININSIIMASPNPCKIIFLDNVEALLKNDRYEHTFVVELIKTLKNTKHVKLLITTTCSDEKKISDMKKQADTIIRINNPSFERAYKYISDILDKEGYEYDIDYLKKCIKAFNCNIRNTILNLFSELVIDDEVDERNYFDLNIFSIVQKIFESYHLDLKDLEHALSCDPTLISFMIYDNLLSYVSSKLPKSNQSLFHRYFIQYIRSTYVSTSLLEEYAYKNNDWGLIENANIIRCGVVRATQKKLEQRQQQLTDAQQVAPISYTQITTRAAQHYTNVKKANQYIWENDLTLDNMMLLADLNFAKRIPNSIDQNNVITSYQNNICEKHYRVYRPCFGMCLE